MPSVVLWATKGSLPCTQALLACTDCLSLDGFVSDAPTRSVCPALHHPGTTASLASCLPPQT